MKSFDLDNTLYEACNKFGFSSDIREIFVSLKQNTLVVNTIHNKTNEFLIVLIVYVTSLSTFIVCVCK